MSKVFAFNIAEYQEPVKVEGYYDPEEQLWVNGSGVSYATIAYQTAITLLRTPTTLLVHHPRLLMRRTTTRATSRLDFIKICFDFRTAFCVSAKFGSYAARNMFP